MKVSAKCDYACRAILELSLNWDSKKTVRISEISEKQNISKRYLAQILNQLRGIGLVRSIRGKEGGYVLAKPPSETRLGEVVNQMERLFLPASGSSEKKSVFSKIWKDIEDDIAKKLNEITFKDIADEVRKKDNVIVYQI